MLTEIIRLREEALVSQREALLADAPKSEEPVQRDDAALALFEAALAMSFDEKIANIVNWEDNSDAEDWWEGASWDYLHLRSCDQDTTLEFYAGGTLFDARFLPEGKQPNEYGLRLERRGHLVGHSGGNRDNLRPCVSKRAGHQWPRALRTSRSIHT